MTAYCASKSGYEGFMRALAAEVEAESIRCATVVPGSTLTDFGGRTRDERLASGARFLEPRTSPTRYCGYCFSQTASGHRSWCCGPAKTAR